MHWSQPVGAEPASRIRLASNGRGPIVLGTCAIGGKGSRIVAFCCVIAALTLLPMHGTHAAERYAAMTIDVNSGRILHAEAGDETRYPASLTKMMTIYLVFERLEEGKLSLATSIRVSETAAEEPPSKLGLKPGSTITVENAIKALVTKSANDIAVAIAEHIAGSEAAFARLMTAKAHELGMKRTTFRNANGLPNDEQTTTARDMALLGMRLYDHFPDRVGIFSLRSFSYNGRTYRNHNTMLGRFPGLEGLKTGYTRQSGYNLVASVRRDGRHVIGVVFGGKSGSARNARMQVLLSRAMQRATTERSRQPDVPSFRHKRPMLIARPASVPRAEPRLVEPVKRIDERGGRIRMAAQIGQNSTVAAAISEEAQATPAVAPPAPAPYRMARVRAVSVLPLAQPPAPLAPAPIAVRQPPVLGAPPVQANSMGLGRTPSTLQAQAEQLALRRSIMPASNDAPAAQPQWAAPAAGALQIQIGAFSAQSEALKQLEMARERTGALLAQAGLATPVVTVKGRTFYRARFTGFEASAAANACNALRRHRFDCLVARAE